jgi:hypothetical protein
MFYAWVVFLGFSLLVSCTLVFWFALAYDFFCSLFWLGFGLGLLDSCFFYKPYCCCVWLGLFAFLFALFGGVIWFGLGWLGCLGVKGNSCIWDFKVG